MEIFNKIASFIEKTFENKKVVNLSKAVKSTYIFEYIFSFLYIKKKLNIIIYYKKLQKKFNINIDNYKAISGKIHIGERNGIGKEFRLNSNILLFEGEYSNGKRNGKGKEYNYDGKLIFEGEYLNGKKNREGIEYYNGKLKFKGEYLNDKRWNGKGYDSNNNNIYILNNGNGHVKEINSELEFEGEYLNGEKNGKGKEYNDDGELIFDGVYLNGEKNGKGKEYYSNGALDLKENI